MWIKNANENNDSIMDFIQKFVWSNHNSPEHKDVSFFERNYSLARHLSTDIQLESNYFHEGYQRV